MDKQTIIKGLKDLVKDRESFADEKDPDCIFSYDKKVLEEARKIIEAAPEVPVQEQPQKLTFNVKKFKANLPTYLQNLDVSEGSVIHDLAKVFVSSFE